MNIMGFPSQILNDTKLFFLFPLQENNPPGGRVKGMMSLDGFKTPNIVCASRGDALHGLKVVS